MSLKQRSVMSIYLDHNVMCDYINNRNAGVVGKINNLLDNIAINLPYSPAHIEEVANIKKSEISNDLKCEYMVENLNIISRITNNYCYLPSEHEIDIVVESPFDCMIRVMDNYDGTTGVAEKIQKDEFDTRFNKHEDYKIENINNMKPAEVFSNEVVIQRLESFCKNYTESLSDLKVNLNLFEKVQFVISNLVNFLELIGYYYDKQDKSRSNMHDISHLIYASKADYFVTGDRNTKFKAAAIYSFLDIDTEVLDRNGFIDLKIHKVE